MVEQMCTSMYSIAQMKSNFQARERYRCLCERIFMRRKNNFKIGFSKITWTSLTGMKDLNMPDFPCGITECNLLTEVCNSRVNPADVTG